MRYSARSLWRTRALPALLVLSLSCAQVVAQQPSAPLLWFQQGRATSQALALLAELRAADRYGLQSADYGAEGLSE